METQIAQLMLMQTSYQNYVFSKRYNEIRKEIYRIP